MKKMLIMPLLLAVLALGSAPGLASAKGKDGDDSHGKGGEKQEQKDKKHGKGHTEKGKQGIEGQSERSTVIIDQDRRTIIQQYYDSTYVKKGKCPPGLAKKGNGCLPPGQAKKVWEAHRPLPPSVLIVPLPSDLIHKIGPPPVGYEYGYVDGDILLYSIVGHVVVDSIAALF